DLRPSRRAHADGVPAAPTGRQGGPGGPHRGAGAGGRGAGGERRGRARIPGLTRPRPKLYSFLCRSKGGEFFDRRIEGKSISARSAFRPVVDGVIEYAMG